MIYFIIVLFFIIFISKIFFWLYTFQLKEYRFDRFKEYAQTSQGKKAFFNLFLIGEAPFFIISFIGIYNKIIGKVLTKTVSEQLYKPILVILIVEFLVLLLKIKQKKVLKPQFTFRAILIFVISIILFISLGTLIYFKYNFLFSFFILFSLIFPYLYIFIANILILPIINYSKNKVINKAKEISKKYDKVVKIGITGSYGKSTVKEFLSQILAYKYEVLKTPKNTNTEMGVSEIIINKLNNNFDFFVAEMGAYRIGEIETLGEIVNHKFAFLTAIGTQHLGLFGSQENIAKAKFEIIKKVIENNGKIYLNIDNLEIVKFLKNNDNIPAGNIVLYGLENPSQAHSKIIKYDINSTVFEFNYKGIKETFETHIIGKHNVLNLTGVIAFCLDIGMDINDIKKAILNLSLPQDSYLVKDIDVLNHFGKFKAKVIASTRNLSVASLETGVEILCSIPNRRRILVIEDILELGKKAKEIHKKLGEQIGKKDISDIYYIGVNYANSFLKGLYEVDFEGNFIDGKFDKEDIQEDVSVMFLGKRTQKTLDYFLKHAGVEAKVHELIK